MTLDLFDHFETSNPAKELLAPDAFILRKFALTYETALLADLKKIIELAPFQQAFTPGGFKMSVNMTSCGNFGWISEHSGYRYATRNPLNTHTWPAIPDSFFALAIEAATEAGFPDFKPDACLINCYLPGAKMGLHQDKNELDLTQPIVSVSLGIPAVFLFGGFQRSDKTTRTYLSHGDIVIWGGSSRLRFHGVLPVKDSYHPVLGKQRINLTFRKVA